MSWPSHGSRGARTSSAFIQPRRVSFTLPHLCTEHSVSIRTDSFPPKQPYAASRTSSRVRESRGVWSTEGTWEKPHRPPPARARHRP